MKDASNNFKTEIAKEVSSLVRLWDIVTRGGQRYYMTDSDVDITWNNNVYKATEGFECSAIASEYGSGAQNLTISFALSPKESSINRRKIYEANMDSADITLRAINRLLPSAGVVVLFGGRIDQIEFDDLNNVKFEIIGRVESGQSNLKMEQYSALCRADFGDPRCKILLSDHTLEVTVDILNDDSSFFSEALMEQEEGYWSFGFVEFTSGRNDGIIVELSYVNPENGMARTQLAFPGALVVGDTVKFTRGCDKTKDNCKAYNNIINFRGEPFPPTPETVDDDEPEEDE